MGEEGGERGLDGEEKERMFARAKISPVQHGNGEKARVWGFGAERRDEKRGR